MAKKASPHRRLIITKNLILMLVVLVVGLLAVWSWFTVNQKVEANNISVRAAFPNEVSVAKVIKYYNDNGDLLAEGPDVFSGQIDYGTEVNPNDFRFNKDCTGNGETLIIPDFSVIKDKDEALVQGRIVNHNGNWEEALSQLDVENIRRHDPEANAEASYMEFEFYVRSTTRNVSLTSSSYLRTPSDDPNVDRMSSALNANVSDGKKSQYGDFSVDGLAGAMRVAFLCQNVSVTQKIGIDNSGGNAVAYIDDQLNGGTTLPKVNNVYQFGTKATFDNTNRPCQLSKLWIPRPDLVLKAKTTLDGWELYNGVTAGNSNTLEIGGESVTFGQLTRLHQFFLPSGADGTPRSYTGEILTNRNVEHMTSSDTSAEKTISKRTGTGVSESTWRDTDDNSKLIISKTVNGTNYATLGQDAVISSLDYSDNAWVQSTLKRDATVPDSDTTNFRNYYVFKYKMRIWIEGTDTEARRAMDGGTFNLHLELK